MWRLRAGSRMRAGLQGEPGWRHPSEEVIVEVAGLGGKPGSAVWC